MHPINQSLNTFLSLLISYLISYLISQTYCLTLSIPCPSPHLTLPINLLIIISFHVSLMQPIVSSIMEKSDTFKPIMDILANRARRSNTLRVQQGNAHSIYREIMFLSFAALKRDNIDIGLGFGYWFGYGFGYGFGLDNIYIGLVSFGILVLVWVLVWVWVWVLLWVWVWFG